MLVTTGCGAGVGAAAATGSGEEVGTGLDVGLGVGEGEGILIAAVFASVFCFVITCWGVISLKATAVDTTARIEIKIAEARPFWFKNFIGSQI